MIGVRKAAVARVAGRRRSRRAQRGNALMMALFALIAMLAAGAALLRAGADGEGGDPQARRTPWRRAAVQSVDAALNDATLAYLRASADPLLQVVDRNRTDASIRYYATEQPLDADGVPRVLSSARTPAWTSSGPSSTGWPGETVDAGSRLLRRYVIERLCSRGGIASADHCHGYPVRFDAQCLLVDGGGCAPADSEWLPYVRISVRIDGPHQTVVYGQMLMKGD